MEQMRMSDSRKSNAFRCEGERRPVWWSLILGLSLSGVLFGVVGLITRNPVWPSEIVLAFFLPGIPISIIKLVNPHEMRRTPHGYEVTRSFWSVYSYAMLCGGWLIGALVFYFEMPETRPFSLLLAGLCLFGFLFALVYAIDTKPLIVINHEGFFDRSLRLGVIPWSAIEGASAVSVKGIDIISLTLKPESSYRGRPRHGDRFFSLLDQAIGFELLHLGMVKLNAEYIDEVLDFVLGHCGKEEEEAAMSALLSFSSQEGSSQQA